jgi:hypothetical protein
MKSKTMKHPKYRIQLPAKSLVFWVAFWNVTVSLILVSCSELNAQEGVSVRVNDEKPLPISMKASEGTVEIKIDNQPFTIYDFGSFKKPIFFPVLAAGQIPMTRSGPMKPLTGEADDHPHHKSMWFAHEVNGIDFWSEKGGEIKSAGTPELDADTARMVTRSNWISNEGKTICTDEMNFEFGGTESVRWIDCTAALIASHGPLEIKDTKEGTFAIRTHPNLRLKPDKDRGVEKVFGGAINSEGEKGIAVWGKPAKWVLYFGSINDRPCSIAMLDHPHNFRHPTTWHAREYGLVTANPFGLKDFLKMPPGHGAVHLADGQRLTLRYKIVFFNSVVNAQEVESWFQDFSRN